MSGLLDRLDQRVTAARDLEACANAASGWDDLVPLRGSDVLALTRAVRAAIDIRQGARGMLNDVLVDIADYKALINALAPFVETTE